jgi:hypothetical protein
MIPINTVWLPEKPDGSLHLDHETMCYLFTLFQFTLYIFKHPAPTAHVVTPMRMRRLIVLSDALKMAFYIFDLASQPGKFNSKNPRAIEYMLRDQGEIILARVWMGLNPQDNSPLMRRPRDPCPPLSVQ